MKRITIRDVAREAGVSVTLVSFVMNAKRDKDGNLDCPVNPETAKRVLQVAQKLGYRRNFAAASLRSGKSNAIAVIPNDISNKFFAGISRCIEDKARSMGYTVFFASSDESSERLESVIDAVLAHNIDGMIVAPCTGGEAAINKAIDAKVPVVLLDRDFPFLAQFLHGLGHFLDQDCFLLKFTNQLLFVLFKALLRLCDFLPKALNVAGINLDVSHQPKRCIIVYHFRTAYVSAISEGNQLVFLLADGDHLLGDCVLLLLDFSFRIFDAAL